MADSLVVQTLASVVASSAPLVYAGIGELLTEKSGVVNLSLDGTILLSAMVGFAAAYATNSVFFGFLAAMLVGAAIAGLIAYSSIALRQDQVAVGLVLTLLCGDLSSFLGAPYVHLPGPSVPHWAIPGLSALPVVGPILFSHNLMVYLSYVAVFAAWLWIAKTRPGLRMRGVGERPEAAFARGVDVNRTRYLYTLLGGALVGMAGAAYSLSVKLGWTHRHTAGLGWIALAIVIFGGWNPFRVAFGAYLFGLLKSLGSILQPTFPQMPSQVFQTAPFALMILALLLVSGDLTERLPLYIPAPVRRAFIALFVGRPPAGLGKRFEAD